METKHYSLILVSWLLAFNLAEAKQSNDCQVVSYQTLIRCADVQSSQLSIVDQRLKAATKLEDISRQWVNPELDANSVSKGSEKSETTATLFFTFRLGGKKSALISEAKSEYEKANANRDIDRGTFRLQTMLALYRLTHLKTEIGIEEETVGTFGKIVKQFQSRRVLAPEQDVSLSVFKMAHADHTLKLNDLRREREQIVRELNAVAGLSEDLVMKNLPLRRQSWESVGSTSGISETPQVRAAEAELKISRSLKARADAEAWPDLRVGPSIKSIKDNTISDTYVGVGLALPLPLFTLNGGKKSYAAQKITEAEIGLDLAKRKTLAMREQLLSRYNETVSALKTSLSLKDINEKHEKIEQLFFRGVVPSSLVIEAHRQLIDLETQRNKSEMQALEALGQILILDNKFSEVIL